VDADTVEAWAAVDRGGVRVTGRAGLASDIAREAADIILLKSEIEAVPEALGLARATLRTIKQNLFWAFFYNALGVPLAALGFISPIFCAAAMGASDLIVIGNALRLLRWRIWNCKSVGLLYTNQIMHFVSVK
jgi:cation transport ATPase